MRGHGTRTPSPLLTTDDMKKVLALLLLAALPLLGRSAAPPQADEYTIVGEKNYLTGYAPENPDGTINVVVEIPPGTCAKWEVDKSDGSLRWEFRNGQPRVVKYLGYPGNYGMVPRTLLPKELGGDGDPLDVIVLGPAVGRGEVISARLVGVLRLLDGGEQDDKLLAIPEDSPLASVDGLAALTEDYHGVTTIVETWFANYKGPGEMESKGFADAQVARDILRASIDAYAAAHAK